MVTYFRKEILRNRIIVGGSPIAFEQLSGDLGVITVDDATQPEIAAALKEAASKRLYGVVEITEEQLAQIKKKRSLTLSAPRLPRKDVLRAMQSPRIMPKSLLAEKPQSPASPVDKNEKPELPSQKPVEIVATGEPKKAETFKPKMRRVKAEPLSAI